MTEEPHRKRSTDMVRNPSTVTDASRAGSIPAALAEKHSEDEIAAGWPESSVMPLVTIICHAFNHEEFIADAICGFLAQNTRFPFEIILRDDASTDGTAAVVRDFAERYPHIVRAIIEKENKFSLGMKPPLATFPMVRGKFIALCEGDDYWCDPNKLQLQVDCMDRHPEAGLCIHPATMALCTSAGERNAGIFCSHGSEERVLSTSDIFHHLFQFAPTSSYFFRAERIDACLTFLAAENPTFFDFFLECITAQGHIAYLPMPMSVYRRNHPQSYSYRESKLGAPQIIERYARNASATRATSCLPWVSADDIQARLRLLRLDSVRKLVTIQAFDHIGQIRADGPVASREFRDWFHTHISSRVPRTMSAAIAIWRKTKARLRSVLA